MDYDDLINYSKLNKVHLIAIIQNKNNEINKLNTELNNIKDINNSLIKENELLKNPPTPLHKKRLLELLEYYVFENCYWSDNIVDETCVLRAPFDFDSLYYHFNSWCDENNLIGRVKDIQKRSIVKTFVMKIQDGSKYGLKLERKKVDNAINGTKSNLFINFNKKE